LRGKTFWGVLGVLAWLILSASYAFACPGKKPANQFTPPAACQANSCGKTQKAPSALAEDDSCNCPAGSACRLISQKLPKWAAILPRMAPLADGSPAGLTLTLGLVPSRIGNQSAPPLGPDRPPGPLYLKNSVLLI